MTQPDSCGIDTFKLDICGPKRFSAYNNIEKEYFTTSRDPNTRIFFDAKNGKIHKFEMPTNDRFARFIVCTSDNIESNHSSDKSNNAIFDGEDEWKRMFGNKCEQKNMINVQTTQKRKTSSICNKKSRAFQAFV